jgi:hypothetical protein
LCLKLPLLSMSHHFNWTCTNRPIFLVVQVDLILNSCLWIRPSPISELQHALLPPKCYKLKSMPQLSYFSIVLLGDPHSGLLENLRVCHISNPLPLPLHSNIQLGNDILLIISNKWFFNIYSHCLNFFLSCS